MKLRVVADINTLIAGLLWRGAAFDVIAGAGSTLELLTSLPLITELSDALARPKFESRVRWTERSVEALVAQLVASSTLVSPSTNSYPVRDPDDLKVIQTAVGGSADLIVTTDTDLLVLRAIEGIGICPPS